MRLVDDDGDYTEVGHFHAMGDWDSQWRTLIEWAEGIVIYHPNVVDRKRAYEMLKILKAMYEDYTYD